MIVHHPLICTRWLQHPPADPGTELRRTSGSEETFSQISTVMTLTLGVIGTVLILGETGTTLTLGDRGTFLIRREALILGEEGTGTLLIEEIGTDWREEEGIL